MKLNSNKMLPSVLKMTAITFTILLTSALQAKNKDVAFKRNIDILRVIKNDLIQSNGQKAKVSKAMVKKRFILVYFSAHWCPPCRKFTPKLVKWYNADHEDYSVIFVSSDENQKEMNKYMEEAKMPWVGLKKGGDSEKIMNQKFRISDGIPSLVLIEKGQIVKLQSRTPAGVFNEMNKLLNKGKNRDLINKSESKKAVSKENKPFIFQSNRDVLKAIKNDLISANGKKGKITREMVKQKSLLVYFSSNQCGPCSKFTPELVEWYKDHKKEYSLLFVSSNSSEEEMKDNMEETEMPWFGIKKGSDSEALMNKHFKTGKFIPNLVLVEKGKVVSSFYKDGRYIGSSNQYKVMTEMLKKSKTKK